MSLLYRVARDVELISRCAGWGSFDVGADDWKCPRCLVDDDVKAGFASGLCTPCRARWLQQLGHVEYSDAFERRLYVISGIAGIVLGLGVWGCNIQLDWWEQGAALGLVWEIVTAHTPVLITLILTSTIVSILLDILLAIAVLLSILAFFAVQSIAWFLLLSNPSAQRHWRHMTPGMYGLVAGQFGIYFLFMNWGITIRELSFIIAPLVIGASSLIGIRFMRRQVDTVDLEAGVKIAVVHDGKGVEREM